MKYLPYILLYFVVHTYQAQTQKRTILKNGWYQATKSCQNLNYLYTNKEVEKVWVKVNANMVVYVGKKKSNKKENNLLHQNKLLKIPILKTKRIHNKLIYYARCYVDSDDPSHDKGFTCEIRLHK